MAGAHLAEVGRLPFMPDATWKRPSPSTSALKKRWEKCSLNSLGEDPLVGARGGKSALAKKDNVCVPKDQLRLSKLRFSGLVFKLLSVRELASYGTP
jgi:hypothetical protein